MTIDRTNNEPVFIASMTIAFASAAIKERIDEQAKALIKIAQVSDDKKTITFPDPHYVVTFEGEKYNEHIWKLVDPEWEAIKNVPISQLGGVLPGGIINASEITGGHSATFHMPKDLNIDEEVSRVIKNAAISIAYANTTSIEIRKAMGVPDGKIQIMNIRGIAPTCGVEHNLEPES